MKSTATDATDILRRKRLQRAEAQRQKMHKRYAAAVQLYADTDMPLKDIALRCGHSRGALGQYLRRYKRELVLRRHGVDAADNDPGNVKLSAAGQPIESAKAKYMPAIDACRSMEYIELNVSQIARKFGLNATALANYMRVHYEDVMPERERQRQLLGIADNIHHGARRVSTETYATAIEMYSTTDMPLPEVAMRCKVSERGLSQYLRFYHKEILRQKGDRRKRAKHERATMNEKLIINNDKYRRQPVSADLKSAATDSTETTILGNGRRNRPAASTVMKYAAAFALYKETALTMKDIVARTGVSEQGFRFYLHRWHLKLVLERAGIDADSVDNGRIDIRKARQRMKTTAYKYSAVIESLKQHPRTVSAAAREFGLNPENLRQYLHKHEPELIKQLGVSH